MVPLWWATVKVEPMKRLLATLLGRWASRLMDQHLTRIAAGTQKTDYAIFVYHLGYALLYASRCVRWGKGGVR